MSLIFKIYTKENSMTGKVVLYACGGAGINIAQHFESFRGKAAEGGFAEVQTVYVDTSRSNLPAKASPDAFYLVENLDGSGKIRAENHREIAESIHDILLNFKPGDLNIVMSSLSGGSGSVIAPSLVSELLQRDANVIVIGISSVDSRIEIENSIKTLKSYEAVSKMRDKPVVLVHYENSETEPLSAVDTQAREAIVRLAALFSRQNRELDSADLRNLLQYNKVTDSKPKVVSMVFQSGTVVRGKAHVIAVATLTTDEFSSSPGTPVGYRCTGYIRQDNASNINLTAPMHYGIFDGLVLEHYSRLSSCLEKFDEATLASRRTTSSLLSGNDKPTDNGLVL